MMSDDPKTELQRELSFWEDQLEGDPQGSLVDAMRDRIRVLREQLRNLEQKE